MFKCKLILQFLTDFVQLGLILNLMRLNNFLLQFYNDIFKKHHQCMLDFVISGKIKNQRKLRYLKEMTNLDNCIRYKMRLY